MILNPNSWNVTMQQLVTPIRTVGGYVVQHWGHNPDTISVEGWSAAFYLSGEELSLINDPGGVSDGITSAHRRFTEGYRHFLKLLEVFRHNGVDVLPKGMPKRAGLGAIEIQYQGVVYLGHFLEFNYTESEENPYSIQYSYTFKVRREITLDFALRKKIDIGRKLVPKQSFLSELISV